MPLRIPNFPVDALKELVLTQKVLDPTQNFRQSQDEAYRNDINGSESASFHSLDIAESKR
jgi:hypothetical protein